MKATAYSGLSDVPMTFIFGRGVSSSSFLFEFMIPDDVEDEIEMSKERCAENRELWSNWLALIWRWKTKLLYGA